ncbi:MAG: SPOR domain-containing protein [Gammaproteobacteria bacterium]|nr:SPOR domain-containing protein [Gammaproteobacteria bacterium]
MLGGAVLVALAVIFLPMLLEDDAALDQGFSDQAVPPSSLDQQGFQSRTLGLPGQAADGAPGIEPMIEPPPVFIPPRDPQLNQPIALPKPEPAPSVAPAAPLAQTQPAPPPPLQPEAKPAPKPAPKPVAKPEPKPAPKPVAKPEPKPVVKPAPAAQASEGGWVIQVASVTNKMSADELAAKLWVKDYPVQVSSAEVGGRTWYRVRIGPDMNRARIDSLLARLQSDPLAAGLEPKVISNR